MNKYQRLSEQYAENARQDLLAMATVQLSHISPTLTILGSCGNNHSLDQWRDCKICKAIDDHRRGL